LAAALLLAGLFSPASAEPPAGSPVAVNGLLRVCGTKLCNKYGRPIQLRGMSTHGLQWYSQCVNRKSLDALATAWKADVIRISMYIQEGGYVTDPRGFTDRVHAIIEQATARGLYAIVDWHMLNPGDPHYNFARANVFFDEMARRHKDKINVIYEVANEPNNDPAGYPATWTKVPVTWARIRAYHQRSFRLSAHKTATGLSCSELRAGDLWGFRTGGTKRK
jgi:endoglucanase